MTRFSHNSPERKPAEPTSEDLDVMMSRVLELDKLRKDALDLVLNRLEIGMGIDEALDSVRDRYGRVMREELNARLGDTVLKAHSRRRLA